MAGWVLKQPCASRHYEKFQVPMDQVELEIYRVHGLTDKTDNRGSFWIKYDLGYSKDEKIGVGVRGVVCRCLCGVLWRKEAFGGGSCRSVVRGVSRGGT